MKWLTEDRALRIAAVLFVVALAFAWFTSPVVAAVKEMLT